MEDQTQRYQLRLLTGFAFMKFDKKFLISSATQIWGFTAKKGDSRVVNGDQSGPSLGL